MPDVLDLDHLLEKYVDLPIAVPGQVVVLDYFYQVLVGYVVYLLAYPADQQLAHLFLNTLALQLELVDVESLREGRKRPGL